jgi:exopolysaccharide biosynthesis WecB/TagA/CpsF family protein
MMRVVDVARVAPEPDEAVEVLGITIPVLDEADALARIAALVERSEPAFVAFANAHTLNLAHSDARFAHVLHHADLVLNDGAGVALAARMAGCRFPANLNGSDLTPKILQLAVERGWSVFFLGARPGVAAAAGEAMRRQLPGLRIAGTRDGMFPVEQEHAVAAEVRASGADICLVALGNPLQEYFLARYLPLLGVRLGIGVGAFFDFAAAQVPRAPAWMNRLGIEWVYRLAQEPRRLFRRYVIGNPVFLLRAIGARARVRARCAR